MPVHGNVASQDITSAFGCNGVLIAATMKPLGLSSKCWELLGVCSCFSAGVQFPLCFLAPRRLVRFCGWNVWPSLSCGRVITETVPLNFTLDVVWLPFCNSGEGFVTDVFWFLFGYIRYGLMNPDLSGVTIPCSFLQEQGVWFRGFQATSLEEYGTITRPLHSRVSG